MVGEPPTNLAEIELRAELEDQIRQEFQVRDEVERRMDQSKAVLALYLTLVFLVAVTIPALALIAGFSLRLFWWAGGW